MRGKKRDNREKLLLLYSDSGTRHYSRFWNDEYLAREGITVSSSIQHILE
jgi:cysteine synthase A